jgi:hypothetical protein
MGSSIEEEKIDSGGGRRDEIALLRSRRGVTNHQFTLHNILEERRSHLHCCGNLKPCILFSCSAIFHEVSV